MKKESKAKNKILDAAEEVFALKGFGSARTAEIASRASVNKALLHYYYATKEGLYFAVMDRLLFELINITQDVLRRGLKGSELVEGVFDAFFDYSAKHRHFARLTTIDGAGNQARYLENILRNFFKPLFERACDHIRNESKKGNLKEVDAPNLLITIYLSVLTYFSNSQFLSAMTGYDILSPKKLTERKKFLRETIRSVLIG